MATLKGKDSWKDVPLIVTCHENGILYNKNEKTGERDPEAGVYGRYLTVQVDQSLLDPEKVRSGEKPADPNPYLNTERKTWQDDKGEDRSFTDHSKFYHESVYQQMLAAASKGPKGDGKAKKVASIETPRGAKMEILGIRGNLGKDSRTKEMFVLSGEDYPIVCNTNPKFGQTVLERQKAVTSAARDYRDAQREASKSAPAAEVEAQAEIPTVDMDAPEI